MADSAVLPPLTLDLPPSNIQLPPIHELFAELDELSHRATSSCQLTTSFMPSRSSSLVHTCLRPCTNTVSTSPSTTPSTRKFRLVLASHDDADAFMVVTPSADPKAPPKPLLLVGPALQRLRQGQCKLQKGTRVFPYRILPHPSERRPPSGSSDAQV